MDISQTGLKTKSRMKTFTCDYEILFSFFQAKNVDFFKQFVTEDFTTYLNRKRSEHCHGNHIEMQALCELYNRPIEVYQSSLGGWLNVS